MDLWSVHVRSTNGGAFYAKLYPCSPRNLVQEKTIAWSMWKTGALRVEDGKLIEVRVPRRNVNSANRSFVVKAMGKKNQGNSSSSGEFSVLILHSFCGILIISIWEFNFGTLVFFYILVVFSTVCSSSFLYFSLLYLVFSSSHFL